MSPSLELQGAIVARLKGTAAVTSLIGSRVFDQADGSAVFPYVTVGEGDEITDDTECVKGFDLAINIHVWSRSVGFPEVKRISDAVRNALLTPEMSLTTNALVYFEHDQTRFLRDPDGLTSHAVLTFEAFVEQP